MRTIWNKFVSIVLTLFVVVWALLLLIIAILLEFSWAKGKTPRTFPPSFKDKK